MKTFSLLGQKKITCQQLSDAHCFCKFLLNVSAIPAEKGEGGWVNIWSHWSLQPTLYYQHPSDLNQNQISAKVMSDELTNIALTHEAMSQFTCPLLLSVTIPVSINCLLLSPKFSFRRWCWSNLYDFVNSRNLEKSCIINWRLMRAPSSKLVW